MATHEALTYRTGDEFASAVRPFVLDGIEAGEAVFASGFPANIDALRNAIGGAADEVRFVDLKEWYVKPVRTLGDYLSFIREQLEEGRTGVRIFGEGVWLDNDPDLQREWLRYESSLNAVLGDLPVRVMCTYDTERLTPSRIDAARATHPTMIERGVESRNDRYTPPEQMLADLTIRLPIPVRHEERRVDVSDVVGAAAFVIERARHAGLTEDAASNVAAALTEIVSWDAARSGGLVLVATWPDGGDFICQVEDDSATPPDPLAGYGPPGPEAPDDWGLWLARHLSDLLEVGTGSRGTAVRLTMRPT